MKILQVMAGAKHGGAETAFVDVCIAMHQAGQDIEVVTRANSIRVPRLREAGIVVHCLPFGGAVDVFTSWRLRKIIQKFKPDIVQGWMSRGSSKIPAWSPSMKIPKYHVVARLGNYYNLKYFQTVDYFVPVTPQIGEYLRKERIHPDRLQQINNFAETEDVITPLKRADFDVPADATLILGLGRLHAKKAFDVLIQAVADMAHVYVLIAGEGPERQNLENMIEALGVKDRVQLLGWRSDRAALLQLCDMCAFISRYEPFGTVFVQSWAQKTPVIVSEADGPRQFVRHERDALMIPIDDVEALKAAIQRLIDHLDLRQRLVENGFKRYKDEFTKGKTVQAYLDYYTDILDKSKVDERAA